MVRLDLSRFQLRRVNPFPGLMIDATAWRDAHDYHRGMLRLHQLAMHGWGIVQGLEVQVADDTNGVVVQPGVAIDSDGNIVVVAQPYAHQIDVRRAGTAYLLLQFSEVPAEPNQPVATAGGQPTRMIDAFRIHQRDQPPGERAIELARVACDPAAGHVRPAAEPERPGQNELDLTHRPRVGTADAGHVSVIVPPMLPVSPRVAAAVTERREPPPQPEPEPADAGQAPLRSATPSTITFAIAAHGGQGWDNHVDGLRFLAREVEAATGHPVRIAEPVTPRAAEGIDVLFLTGTDRLTLSDDDMHGLTRLLDSGCVVVGEGCTAGPRGDGGALQLARSFMDATLRLERQLARVDRHHPLLEARYLFTAPPPGAVPGNMLLESNGIVYSGADYGCAWAGGAAERPLSRGGIRETLELGVNLAIYRRREHDGR